MKKAVQAKIGCSGYYNQQWKGIFYPEKLPTSKWFGFYCEHFKTFEINATFYKFPTVKILETWFKKSPDDFIFSVKAPKLITHINKFENSQKLINNFYTVCQQGLLHKLGPILF